MNDKNYEARRSAMFDAWLEKEKEKWNNCPTKHRWSYVKPKYCLDCGKSLSK